MRPEVLPVLPKNIAKNFAETFFRERGRGLVQLEGERLKEQVNGILLSIASHHFVMANSDSCFSCKPKPKPGLVKWWGMPLLGTSQILTPKVACGSAEGDDGRGAGDGAPGEV
jgi:hypothetical protein